MTQTPETRHRLPGPVKLLAFLAVLGVFFVSINLMGGALKILTKSAVKDILEQAVAHPVVGLLLGILTTSIIQSSSTTTSIIVAMTASGTITLSSAVPMIMGANIGTTVTNTLVSLAHVHRKTEFEKALAAGTVHDFFNILSVIALFPLELATGYLRKTAAFVQELIVGHDFGTVSGLKDLIKPLVHGLLDFFHYPGVSLVVALILLFISLMAMVKIMRALFVQKMAKVVDRFLFKNAPVALLMGVIFTVLVQSSSVTTSLIVPLAGAGILSIEQIFPFTLGANVGTTITAFLASLAFAAGAGPELAATAGLGLTVALVHLLFNVSGIVIIYPIRALPIWLARTLGSYVGASGRHVAVFILLYFALYLAPLAMFLFF